MSWKIGGWRYFAGGGEGEDCIHLVAKYFEKLVKNMG